MRHAKLMVAIDDALHNDGFKSVHFKSVNDGIPHLVLCHPRRGPHVNLVIILILIIYHNLSSVVKTTNEKTTVAVSGQFIPLNQYIRRLL